MKFLYKSLIFLIIVNVILVTYVIINFFGDFNKTLILYNSNLKQDTLAYNEEWNHHIIDLFNQTNKSFDSLDLSKNDLININDYNTIFLSSPVLYPDQKKILIKFIRSGGVVITEGISCLWKDDKRTWWDGEYCFKEEMGLVILEKNNISKVHNASFVYNNKINNIELLRGSSKIRGILQKEINIFLYYEELNRKYPLLITKKYGEGHIIHLTESLSSSYYYQKINNLYMDEEFVNLLEYILDKRKFEIKIIRYNYLKNNFLDLFWKIIPPMIILLLFFLLNYKIYKDLRND